jgi:hypothetical protein
MSAGFRPTDAVGELGGTDPVTRKSTVQLIGNNATTSPQASSTAVLGTGWTALRGRHFDDPTATNETTEAGGTSALGGPAGFDRPGAAGRNRSPYPWDRDDDGWVDDPSRFLEHAEQRRAALEALARRAEAQAVRATDPTTIAGAAAASTRTDASGRAHVAVALANATAVASRASYADAPTRRSDRPRTGDPIAAVGATAGADLRRAYRHANPVPAIASRYL